MREELGMLFLLEHFSLEDLVKAEEEYINHQYKNTDNIAESYVDDSWMDLSFKSLVFNED